MPQCLRKFVFSYLGPLVGTKSKKNMHLVNTSRKNNSKKSRTNGNCELKTMKLIQNETVPDTELNDCEQNRVKETHILHDHEHADFDEHGDQTPLYDPEAIEVNSMEWQRAAQILDRFVLLIAVILSVLTFGGIFIQAPRVREELLGTTQVSLEEKILLHNR